LAVRGIKTKIGFNIILLLLVSAIITDVLVMVVVQNAMIRDEMSRSKNYLETIGRLYFSDPAHPRSGSVSTSGVVTQLLRSQDRIQTLYMIDAGDNLVYQHASVDFEFDFFKPKIDAARVSRETGIETLGYEWSLFWWHPKAFSIVIPVQVNDRLNGVIAAVVPMTSIYRTLRKYHKPIFFYIIINTGVLTIVGLYHIFRLYLRPIDRIVMQADDFHEDEDLFFAFRYEDNELNRLSSALNRMLTRISSDKKKLKDTVCSLERANVELKNAQKEIIRSEKMASVGRLAAGIAHEIGNPIGIVLGYLDMLKAKKIADEDKADFLRRTENEVQRINIVIRQLLDLARPGDTQNKQVGVCAVIEDIVAVMQLQPIMSGTQIELDLKASKDIVWGNPDQLRQVFLNILLNAADAIHSTESAGPGQIRVKTANLDGNDVATLSMLQVRFEDNGGGIEPDKLQNLFDPFYTTKEPGKGTGLGLAVSFMIIESMGGAIRAESEPDGGAAFNIELPLAANGVDVEHDES
jgi:signal transduction histidine kinase